MKALSFILSIYFFLMAVMPCCGFESAAQEQDTCCEQTEAGGGCESDDSSEEPSCESCSPFYTCGSCTGFIMPGETSFMTQASVEPIQASLYKSFPELEIPLNIWQPPKI
jgi:hypothetical protein